MMEPGPTRRPSVWDLPCPALLGHTEKSRKVKQEAACGFPGTQEVLPIATSPAPVWFACHTHPAGAAGAPAWQLSLGTPESLLHYILGEAGSAGTLLSWEGLLPPFLPLGKIHLLQVWEAQQCWRAHHLHSGGRGRHHLGQALTGPGHRDPPSPSLPLTDGSSPRERKGLAGVALFHAGRAGVKKQQPSDLFLS